MREFSGYSPHQSKLSVLVLMIVLLVSAVIDGEAHAAIFMKSRQVKPVPVKATDIYVKKVNAFIKDSRWQPGTLYSNSQKPKLSKYSCVGCCAYAADFVQYVFGKSSPRGGIAFNNLAQVRAGDVIVLSNPSHWIVVLARSGNSLETLEGNWMERVVRAKGVYTLNGKTLMRNGKNFRTFSVGYHFL